MTNPLDATATTPVSATIRDCLVHAWVASNNPATPGTWMIDVGGHENPGPPVDRNKHASMDGVRDMLRQWASEHHELFD